MADTLFTAGDEFTHTMRITEDKLPKTIPSSSTIEAALVDENEIVLISATGVSQGTPGSDWPSGVVVVVFSAALTGAVATPNLVQIQLRVTDSSGKPVSYWSAFFQVKASGI